MRSLHSITLRYDVNEDRILAAVNAGCDDAWACWLTRRLSLAILERLNPYLDETSAMIARTPLEHREDAATMEREVALASTRGSISMTPEDVIAKAGMAGELAAEFTVAPQQDRFVIQITGREGGQARGLLTRPELQTILQMLEQEVTRASWKVVPAATQTERGAATPERKRRAN